MGSDVTSGFYLKLHLNCMKSLIKKYFSQNVDKNVIRYKKIFQINVVFQRIVLELYPHTL